MLDSTRKQQMELTRDNPNGPVDLALVLRGQIEGFAASLAERVPNNCTFEQSFSITRSNFTRFPDSPNPRVRAPHRSGDQRVCLGSLLDTAGRPRADHRASTSCRIHRLGLRLPTRPRDVERPLLCKNLLELSVASWHRHFRELLTVFSLL